jgi:hypothetical protein
MKKKNYNLIMIPRQPHLKQVEYNNKVQLSNNLMLKDIIKKIKKIKFKSTCVNSLIS